MEILKIGKYKLIPTDTLSEIGLESIPNYVVGEVIDDNLYYDITSNENWMTIGLSFMDYLACRNQIKYRTAIIGFDNLPLSEQLIAAKNFVVVKSDRDKVLTEQEQVNEWEWFVIFSREQRLKRWDKAKAYISYVLTPAQSVEVALESESYSKNFIEYGIESLSIDGVTGLYDWLENNFILKSYFNETYKNNILSILQKGFY